jgi:outer membrane PBP1 activator LpoA protein
MLVPIRLLMLLLALTLAGCAKQTVRPADVPLVTEAEGLLGSGDFSGAAQIYRQLAERSGAPDYYHLLAADAELRAGNGRAAQMLLNGVNPETLETVDQHRYVLLKSRLDLNQGKARQAMALLETLSPEQLEPPMLANYHTLRASAYNQLGNMLESARERVLLGRLLTNPQALQKNNEVIFDTLSRLPPKALTDLQPAPPDTLGGWMALVNIMKGKPAERVQALQAWRAAFPGHPADGAFLQGMTQQTERGVQVTPLNPRAESAAPSTDQSQQAASAPPTGRFIGVMLPLSGSYAPAGQAIRSGMIAAYYADGDPSKPALRFVDSQKSNVYALYRQLVGEGAEFVIGPLIKDEVTALAQGGDLSVPVLALNQAPGITQDRLYQFGLTPEQEVEQSAGSAWFDGRQNALLLAPASAFGQRMINHFTGYWKSLGGRVLAIKTYRPGGDDFSAPVGDLFAAVGSGQASGADFAFLIADARDARLLLPQMQSQQAGQIPVYATSHVFGGHPEQDQDLSGLIFCDIPWLLHPGEGGSLSKESLQAIVQQTPENYLRLIAMGIDAYNLVPQLEQLRTSPQNRYSGATGSLALQAGNRIRRQLHCAQFEGGALQPRGIAPLLEPGAAGRVSAP